MKTGQASYVAELLDRFASEDGSENPAVYLLLTETLSRVSTQADPWLALRYFEVHLLDHLGYRPLLFQCANCGKEIKAEDQFFSPLAGGVICPSCGSSLPGVWQISLEALRNFRHFQRSSYAEASRARPSLEVCQELEGMLQKYLTYLLERSLNTPGFIRQITPKSATDQ
jgi:DNA repair protein RecO (recombination protein O)